MAQYNPPSQNLPIFDSGLFGGTNPNSGSTPSGDYLNFPNAQGDENLLGITVADSATFNADSTFNDVVDINNDATFSTNIIMSGTYLTNYIQFPDGTQQFTADSGTTGAAILANGTSSSPQTFTGNNFFNSTGPSTVFIGNGNSVNEAISLTSYYNATTLQYGLQISNGGLYLGSNGGTPSSSTYVMLACDDANAGQLNVAGNINQTGTTLTINGNTITSSSSGLTTSGTLTIGSQLTITSTFSGSPTSFTLTTSTTTAETLVLDGNLQLTGGTDSRYISLPYVGQNNILLNQNYDEYLQINSGLTISPNKYTYPSSTNFVNIFADGTTNNQLDIEGNIQTSGQIIISSSGSGITFPDNTIQTTAATDGSNILGTNNSWTGTNAFNTSTPTTTITQTYPQVTSTTQFATIGYVNSGIGTATQYAALLNYGTSVSPQSFTGYNQINLLSFNGQSCPQKIQNNGQSYATNSGSIWTWYKNIPYTLGNGFAFAFSTNNTPTAYDMGGTQAVITSQTNSVISGAGYAVYQPYISNGTTYDAYILNLTGYSGTPTLVSFTTANGLGAGYPVITIQTNDTNPYFNNNSIKMNLYIYPQGVV